MLATTKGGAIAAGRRDLLIKKILERLTGTLDDDGYTNGYMEWGIQHEDEALCAYEALTGNLAERVGFCAHNDLLIGCSPDGVLDDFDGGLEVKAPKSATHWGYLRGPLACPAEYLPQLLHSLWVTGACYWDFLSYDPRMPAPLQTFYVRVERDEAAVQAYAEKALAFLAEVQREVAAAQGWLVVAGASDAA